MRKVKDFNGNMKLQLSGPRVRASCFHREQRGNSLGFLTTIAYNTCSLIYSVLNIILNLRSDSNIFEIRIIKTMMSWRLSDHLEELLFDRSYSLAVTADGEASASSSILLKSTETFLTSRSDLHKHPSFMCFSSRSTSSQTFLTFGEGSGDNTSSRSDRMPAGRLLACLAINTKEVRPSLSAKKAELIAAINSDQSPECGADLVRWQNDKKAALTFACLL